MTDDISHGSRQPARATLRQSATVTDLASRRRDDDDDIVGSVTLVFGGVNYGTIPVRAPYRAGEPFALYLMPASGTWDGPDDEVRGPLDCLITDDVALARALDEAR